MENSGIMSYDNFCVKYLSCNRTKFESVIKAIPTSIISLIKEKICILISWPCVYLHC